MEYTPGEVGIDWLSSLPTRIILMILALIGLYIIYRLILTIVSVDEFQILTIKGKFSRYLRWGQHFKKPWERIQGTYTCKSMATSLEVHGVTDDKASITINILVIHGVEDVGNIVEILFKNPKYTDEILTRTEKRTRVIMAQWRSQDVSVGANDLLETVRNSINEEIHSDGYKIYSLRLKKEAE